MYITRVHCSAVATIDMGRKEGAAVPLSRELGPRLVQCGLGRSLLPYQAASSSIQPFGHNGHGPKIGCGECALFLGVAGSTSNTMSRRPRHTFVPSDSLMHPGRLATIQMGRKFGALPPVLGRGAVSPPSTMWTGPRPTSMPSAILIHPAVRPQ